MITNKCVPIAGTFSKDKLFWGKDFPVNYIEEGEGARVKANNGKIYLDWVCGLGANFLGYGNIGWEQYVNMWLRKGTAFSFPHRLEYQVAEKLCIMLNQTVTYWRTTPLQVRWVKTGSDACEAAIRLARAITDKKYILSFGYHGYHTDFVAMTPPAHGVIGSLGRYMLPLKYNDLEDLEKQYDKRTDIAAIIVEQPLDEPNPDWYDGLRDFCNRHGALLIIDEVVTGLRYARGGACELYNIKPDLVCMGKALGNGLPIAALVGPKEYLDWFNPTVRPNNDPVFVSSTNAGDPLSLASANWILDYTSNSKYLEHIWSVGNKLINGLQAIGYEVLGNAPRSLIKFTDNVQRGEFIARMADRYILMNRPNFINMAHKLNDVIVTVEAAQAVYTIMHTEDRTVGAWAEEKYWVENQPLMLFTNR